jgi:N-acetyltransferase
MESNYTRIFPMKLEPTKLQSKRVILEPLEERHFNELYAILDPQVWEWYTIQIKTPDSLRAFLMMQLHDQAQGKSQSYVVRDIMSGSVVGATRYLNADLFNRRVEIGSTWYAPQWQRTYVNTESKFLLLCHAFEVLSCICVHFITDALNVRSRKAIERLGAKQDGTLRAHRICYDGRIRDSVLYSITDKEWPIVKKHLLNLRARPSPKLL